MVPWYIGSSVSEKSVLGDLDTNLISSQSAIVLVEPKDARNIGAVARAMSNLGFSKLRLVSQHLQVDRASCYEVW